MLTTQAGPPPGPDTPIQGLPYFLPIGAIPITLTGKPATGTDSSGDKTAGGTMTDKTVANPKTAAQAASTDNNTGATPAAPAALLSLTMETLTTNGATPAYSLTMSAGAAKLVADTSFSGSVGFRLWQARPGGSAPWTPAKG
jgi:hypothetical protein